MESDPDNDIDEQAVAWFVRLRADNVSRHDEALFSQWLEQSDAHRSAFYEICVLWGDADFLKGLNDSAKKHAIAPRTKKKRFIKSKMPWALAASLVLAIFFSGPLQLHLKADYFSALGERKTVQLADGSTAMLNTDSAVAIKMDGSQRLVELLKGEVYFDVKPDPNRPFIVQADHSTTRVLGTHFFVHRKSDSDEIKVLSGRVEVSEGRRWKDPIVLRNNETVTVCDTAIGVPRKLDSSLSTSWINGFLVYENETLETVVDHINRYRSGIVFYKDDSLRNLRINGRLSIRNANDMLEVLQKTLAVKMTYLTDWVIIVG